MSRHRCRVAIGAGATFVARTTAAHPREIDKLITMGIKHKGMAIIDDVIFEK